MPQLTFSIIGNSDINQSEFLRLWANSRGYDGAIDQDTNQIITHEKFILNDITTKMFLEVEQQQRNELRANAKFDEDDAVNSLKNAISVEVITE